MAKRNRGIEETPDIVTILNNQFRLMVAQSSATRRMMKEDHELYYSDVEGTRTQFTNNQLDHIQQRYDIPISTKVSWAIIEQMISFITGGKPAPRLLASAAVSQDFTNMYEQAIVASLYEGHFNRELTMCVRDTFAGGIGWLYVRPNDFYAETTFGVVGEYKPWAQVFVDPHAQKPDFSDAEYMCIVDVLPKGKAERKYDITITDYDVTNFAPDIMWGVDTNIVPIVAGWPFDTGMTANKQDRYVWVREFFSKQQVNVYISDTGIISSKKPKPTTMSNPDKAAMGQQIQQFQQQMQANVQQASQASDGLQQAEDMITTPGTNLMQGIQSVQGSQREYEAVAGQLDEQSAQLQEMMISYAEMPDEIPAYEIESLNGEVVTVRNFFKRNQKMVKRWLLVNNRIIEQNVIPCDEYPLIPFTLAVANRPDKIYGIMHFIKDIVKALNKFWSLLIYDMQSSAHRKVLYPKGSITDPSKAEKEWSKPNAFIEYNPIAELPNGGQPVITDGSSLNPAIERILGMLQNLLEYITGISSIVQGQPTAATPDTFGGIQTMQSFGTQRIKLYARWLEDAIERFTYVYVSYLQAYAPKDKVLTYLDDNGDQQEIQLLENSEDIRFKVRANMTSALPTARAMAAQLLGVLGGQTKDPHVQQLLTQYMIEYLDLPESQKIRQEVDAVKNLSGQLEQIQQQLQDLESQNKQLQQQIFQKNLEVDYAKAKAKLQAEMEIASNEVESGQTPQMPNQPQIAGEQQQAAPNQEPGPPPF
jgi:hypothetical protein